MMRFIKKVTHRKRHRNRFRAKPAAYPKTKETEIIPKDPTREIVLQIEEIPPLDVFYSPKHKAVVKRQRKRRRADQPSPFPELTVTGNVVWSAGTNTIKEKVPVRKPAATVSNNHPSSSTTPSSSKTLVVSDSMDYNIVDDMKKTKANITMFELSKLKHQQKLLLKEFNVVPSSPLPTTKAASNSGQPPACRVEATDTILIGDRSNSHTPPFLLTYEIYNRNLHNCLIDSGASSNIMPASVCSKLNIEPQKSFIHIVQLD